MDVVLRIIGIVMLISNPLTLPKKCSTPTSYEVRAVEGRDRRPECGTVTRVHFAFIKTTAPNVTEDHWPWIACTDGSNCKLFPLDGDVITIDPITGSGTMSGSACDLHHMQTDYRMGDLEANMDPDTVAKLTIQSGAVTTDTLHNGMEIAIVTAKLAQSADVVVHSDKGRSITIPKGPATVTIDLLNLPIEEALAVPGSDVGKPDPRHFWLYYRFAKTQPQDPQGCATPSEDMPAQNLQAASRRMAMTAGGPQSGSGRAAAGVDCSSTTYP